MALADDFQELLDSLPADWTDLELDLRISDEDRYVDAAVILSVVNAQPYSKATWHWRIPVAHSFGHAASADTVHGVLAQLDASGFTGDLAVSNLRDTATRSRVQIVRRIVRAPLPFKMLPPAFGGLCPPYWR